MGGNANDEPNCHVFNSRRQRDRFRQWGNGGHESGYCRGSTEGWYKQSVRLANGGECYDGNRRCNQRFDRIQRADLGVYGSEHVGYLAALVERTNHEHILQLDLLATDFFHDCAYPTYLYFNPDREPRRVRIEIGDKARDLYDAVAGDFAARGVHGTAEFEVQPDSARVIVVAPAGGQLTRDGNRTLIDGVVVDYNGSAEGDSR